MTDTSHQRSRPRKAGRLPWRAGLLSLAALAVVAVAVARNHALGALVLGALAHVRPSAVLATLPGQALAILLCVVAQQALSPGVTFAASLASRLVRDAANNLPLMPPGPGDAVGARVLVLAGGTARAATMVRALDVAAEFIGQLPYIAIALFVLSRLWARHVLALPALPAKPIAIAGAVLAAAALLAWRRTAGRSSRIKGRLRGEALLLRHEFARRRRGLPAAVLLHFVAWGMSGVQLWCAALVLGLPLGVAGGIVLESAASAARVLLFFIPGGLVTQEAGIVGAGLVCGLAPTQSLALALVLRLRDVVFGMALLLWPALELRARRFGGLRARA